MFWRSWQHPSFRLSRLSVLVTASLFCSCWAFWLNWWNSAVGSYLYRLPLPCLSVPSSFSIPSCECPCLRDHSDSEGRLILSNDTTRISQVAWENYPPIYGGLKQRRHRREQVDNVHGGWPWTDNFQASAKNVELTSNYQPEACCLLRRASSIEVSL